MTMKSSISLTRRAKKKSMMKKMILRAARMKTRMRMRKI